LKQDQGFEVLSLGMVVANSHHNGHEVYNSMPWDAFIKPGCSRHNPSIPSHIGLIDISDGMIVVGEILGDWEFPMAFDFVRMMMAHFPNGRVTFNSANGESVIFPEFISLFLSIHSCINDTQLKSIH
jgi:hypothetical protein